MMTLSQPFAIDQANEMSVWTMSCESNDLFLVYNPDMSFSKRNLNKPFHLVEQWGKEKIVCEVDDQKLLDQYELIKFDIDFSI